MKFCDLALSPMLCLEHFVSVNSKPDYPPDDPQDSHVPTARGVRFSPNFLCPEGRGFELEKFSTVLEEK